MTPKPDTRATLWAPPVADNASDQDVYGSVDQSTANWTRKGTYWLAMSGNSASNPALAGQSASDQVFTVEIDRRDDFSLDWRLELLDGPYKGHFLYPSALSLENTNARKAKLVCALVRTT